MKLSHVAVAVALITVSTVSMANDTDDFVALPGQAGQETPFMPGGELAPATPFMPGENGQLAPATPFMPGENGQLAPATPFMPGENGQLAPAQLIADLGDHSAAINNPLETPEGWEAVAIRNNFKQLQGEIKDLDSRIDGTNASIHAVANARPMLSHVGQTAVGMGAGFAGGESAIAIGLGHSISESWSVSATLNATTGSNSDVSGGVGAQFNF